MPNEDGTPTVEELKAKAYQPMEDAMKLHPFYKGKIETTLKCCVRDFDDFGIWYTPGVSTRVPSLITATVLPLLVCS